MYATSSSVLEATKYTSVVGKVCVDTSFVCRCAHNLFAIKTHATKHKCEKCYRTNMNPKSKSKQNSLLAPNKCSVCSSHPHPHMPLCVCVCLLKLFLDKCRRFHGYPFPPGNALFVFTFFSSAQLSRSCHRKSETICIVCKVGMLPKVLCCQTSCQRRKVCVQKLQRINFNWPFSYRCG